MRALDAMAPAGTSIAGAANAARRFQVWRMRTCLLAGTDRSKHDGSLPGPERGLP